MCPARLGNNEVRTYDFYYKKAQEKFLEGNFPIDKPISVCNLEDFNENLSGFYGRVKIFKNVIYLHPESKVHKIASKNFEQNIFDSLPEAIKAAYETCSGSVPVFNRYACGSVHHKIPDFSIRKICDPQNFIIAGEVVFRHENEEQLLLESVHYLTEYTSVKYVVVIQLPRDNTSDFNMKIILFERQVDFDPEKKEILVSSLEKGIKKLDKCLEIDFPMNILDWDKDKSCSSLFNFKEMKLIQYTYENYKDELPIEFKIPGSVFDQTESILIHISFDAIREIKTEWQNYRHV
ncbi:unnamed protein product [Brachionus calyciflorus]|uniref:Uncharacterized protein n=1 Tax=Brachionus calyciflorus TaxID=104777 RepID=A0A814HIM9_9BILA|nr:unnamed protein product [Brachionus calyciflorus]